VGYINKTSFKNKTTDTLTAAGHLARATRKLLNLFLAKIYWIGATKLATPFHL